VEKEREVVNTNFPKTATHDLVGGLRREERSKPSAQNGRPRIKFAMYLFGLCFIIFGARALELTVLHEQGGITRSASNGGPTTRLDIVDRNGEVLATDIPLPTLYADARLIWNPTETAHKLASVFPDVDAGKLAKKLSTGSAYVPIKRNVTPEIQRHIYQFGLPGIKFKETVTRIYPHGNLAAHVVGYVSRPDNVGIAGIEKSMEDVIDSRGPSRLPVKLSIDTRVQHAVADELQASIEEFNALGGAGVVMNVNTGEIIALVSLPDFDPNSVMEFPEDARRNRATLSVYEMGSTFKAFTAAMVLDKGIATLSTKFDARHPIKVGRFTISDYHPERRWLTVPEVLIHSSNIASARMALATGISGHREFLARFGLFDRPDLELSEVGRPLVQEWRKITSMTMSYGHGIAVSPVHMAAAASSLVNGGYRVKPTLLRKGHVAKRPQDRVIRQETSEQVLELMRMVVRDGTGGKAEVEGYSVAGKTGTAEKPRAKGYNRKALISSFLGIFPSYDPKFVVLALLDEPKGTKDTYGYATAGWTAAPTVGEIVRRIGPIMAVEPSNDSGKTILASVEE